MWCNGEVVKLIYSEEYLVYIVKILPYVPILGRQNFSVLSKIISKLEKKNQARI